MRLLSLVANLFADGREDPLTRPEIVWGTVGLTVALLAGALVIYVVDRWRKRAAAGYSDDGTGALSSFREMYEAGEITEAEYTELKRRMAERVKKSVGVKEAAVSATQAPAAPLPGQAGGQPSGQSAGQPAGQPGQPPAANQLAPPSGSALPPPPPPPA